MVLELRSVHIRPSQFFQTLALRAFCIRAWSPKPRNYYCLTRNDYPLTDRNFLRLSFQNYTIPGRGSLVQASRVSALFPQQPDQSHTTHAYNRSSAYQR